MRHSKTFVLLAIGAIALAANGCASQAVSENTQNAHSIESDAKESIGGLLFDQKTYFLENKKFATSVKDLKSTVLNQAKSYKYQLQSSPNQKQGVIITATPKSPDLRSLTGVVFVVKSGKSSTVTISQLCETKAPSKNAPVAPATPQRASDKLRCPDGSRSAYEVLAQN